ncbi:HAD-IA family hydrolase [Sphingosinicella rhizophila]|uniref:HAD-IA family hydrolase n=1 Tax=Sphingosinicella rhizophila TaxID=3050082 RepID=A0ABU3Q8H0_9SPHN|nr:HAD-IA family hydrolase [Sphingosinicella sp. GR2756]MDT9599230.1 HAD-IA family hydrolase [Sphingosinicella sp. GR2756]
MNRLAIFDCDGTLVDGQASICAAMESCFVAAGMQAPARERTRRLVGLSMMDAMQVLLPGAEAELHAELVEGYKSAFQQLRRDGLVEEPLYDGVEQVLAALEAEGWLLGVATGKSDRGLGHCLDCHGIKGRFVTLQTADRHPSKPHPSMIEQAMADAGAAPQTTVMIGDTSYDMAMARSAGARAVGVTWGYHGAQDLLAAGAHILADHPSQLPEMIMT